METAFKNFLLKFKGPENWRQHALYDADGEIDIKESLSKLNLPTGLFEKFQSRGEANRGLCALPFTQLFLKNTGDIIPCGCLRHVSLGNINEKPLEIIFNDTPMQEFRKTLLNKEFTHCRSYMDNFACHELHSDLWLEEGTVPAEKVPYSPKRLDLDLNGFCNLKCEMCEVWKGPNGSYHDNNFWNYAPKKIFPYLKEVALLGGEPMLQKDVYRLMEELPEVNPDCRWVITTNGSYRFTKFHKEKLRKLRLKEFGISLDSLDPDTYSKIRIEGNLNLALNTIEEIILLNKERKEKFLVVVNMLISKRSWREVPQFIHYARERGIKLNLEILMEPHSQSLWSMKAKDFETCLETLIEYNGEALHSDLLSIIQTLFQGCNKVSKLNLLQSYQDHLQNFKVRRDLHLNQ